MVTVRVGETDTVAVDVDDVLEWQLPENASTGYAWSITVDDGLRGEDDHAEPPASATPGAAGQHLFRVRAIQPGEWFVRLRLARPWESTALQDHVVRVRVSGAH
jgi:inhibitor of cysteine peptidase